MILRHAQPIPILLPTVAICASLSSTSQASFARCSSPMWIPRAATTRPAITPRHWGRRPTRAASVFNFFPPSYVIPGTAINAPEFALENTAAATLRMTLADSIVRNHLTSFSIDMSPASVLGQIASATGNAATDSANLVTALNILFTHDQMTAAMQSAIAANAALLTDIGQRVRVSTWLVISSNFYKIDQ